jgi:Membrane bound FAD containing D-sorbitol dehydrogenase
MSKSTRRERSQQAQSAPEDDRAYGLTRRTVLAGVAVTTAVVTVGVDTPAVAQSAISDMEAFIQLSVALTGIPAGKLAPATDSIGIRQEYFNWLNEKEPAAFASLLNIVKRKIADNKETAPQTMIDELRTNEDTNFLARSIVLMWYLGSWYSPDDLKRLVDEKSSRVPLFVPHTVISPKAYTQGWVWRIAQAHPMGYSDMQFGYWAREPAPIEDFISRTVAKGT